LRAQADARVKALLQDLDRRADFRALVGNPQT
jgi:hypothetical protein